MMLNLYRRQAQQLKKSLRERAPVACSMEIKTESPFNAFLPEFEDRVSELIRITYFDFTFCHLYAILETEEDLHINRETLRI